MDNTTSFIFATTPHAELLQCLEESLLVNRILILSAIVISILYILILTTLEKREWNRKYCNGRPGLVFPLNSIDGFKTRFSFAFATGGFAGDMLVIILNAIQGKQTLDLLAGGITDKSLNVLYSMVDILVYSLINYPMFACLSTSYRRLGYIMGLFYTIFRVCLMSIPGFWCASFAFESEVMEIALIYFSLFSALSHICYGLLCLCFCIHLAKALLPNNPGKSGSYFITADSKSANNRYDIVSEPFQINRTKMLLSKRPATSIMKEKWYSWFKYSKELNFKYSTRIVVTFFVCFLMNHALFACNMYISVVLFLSFDSVVSRVNIYSLSYLWGPLQASMYTTLIFVAVLTNLNLYAGIKAYRRDMLRLYKGDRSFMPTSLRKIDSPAEMLAYSMRYSSYLIAYTVWGIIMLFIFLLILFFVLICLGKVIVNWEWDTLFILITQLLAPVLLSLLIYYLQVLVCRFVFLQPKIKPEDECNPLAVNNRRILHNLAFYLFFWNLIVGLISSLRRILTASIIGIAFIGRLDHCILMRGFQKYDKGHKAYVGMLEVEHYHTNPVMRTFCQLLLETVRERKSQSFTKKRVCQKWNVAYTLLKNPQLKQYRQSRSRITINDTVAV